MSTNETFFEILKRDELYFQLQKSQDDLEKCLRKAQYSCMRRLISCLVNEKYLSGNVIRVDVANNTEMFLRLKQVECEQDEITECYLKLLHQPITDNGSVTHLDPDECGPTILKVSNIGKPIEIRDPVHIAQSVLVGSKIDIDKCQQFCEELGNCVQRQRYLYQNLPKDPSLFSSILEWEQSLVEGHATHPMHRTLYAEPPMSNILPSADIFETTINFVAVRRDTILTNGPFEERMSEYLARLNISEKHIDIPNREAYLIFPVHSLQLPNILLYFPENFRLLPFTASAKAQASLRTLNLDHYPECHLKLSFGAVTTSSKRTITPWTAYIGPNLITILDTIIKDKDRLIVAKEAASAVSNHPDFNVAKHMAAIFRESSETMLNGSEEAVIPCMALTEFNSKGLPRVCEIFNLVTPTEKIAWLKSYVSALMNVLIPPLVEHGFSFEAHAQNMLLRVDKRRLEIKGFIVRDFGGIKAHQPTLKATTGLTIKVIREGGCAEAYSLKSVNQVAYHTLIQCHLNRFIRVLDLHYNGEGWAVVRKIVEDLSKKYDETSPNYGLFGDWLDCPTTHQKCFIKMKLESLERDYLYLTAPNLLYCTIAK